MPFLLDTNTWIAWLRQNQPSVTTRLQREDPANILLCSVVVGELLFGAERSGETYRVNNRQKIEQLRQQYVSLSFDDAAAEQYGKIRAHLTNLGQMIGANDALISGIALACGLTLVTHNTAEFGRVPGLHIEDWQVP